MDKNLHICMNIKVNMDIVSYPAWNAEYTAFHPSGFSFLYP